jgi:hypothetical protein
MGQASIGTAITKGTELQQLPEAHLFYPGSTIIGQRGADFDRHVAGGPNPAFYGYALGVNAPEDAVLAFYEQQLPALGWTPSNWDNITGTAERRTLAWRKGNLVFSVAIPLKNDPRNSPVGDGFDTPYTIRVTAGPPSR